MPNQAISAALREAIIASGLCAADQVPAFVVETPNAAERGDFTSNVAFAVAAAGRKDATEMADVIVRHLSLPESLGATVTLGGAGFLNFHLDPAWLHQRLQQALAAPDRYGDSTACCGEKALIEFVSANPDAPISLNHARGGTVGDVLANVLTAVGYDATREFYVNDTVTGSQAKRFGRSLAALYRQRLDPSVPYPEDGYRGAYLAEVVETLARTHGDALRETGAAQFAKLAQEIVLGTQRQTLDRFGIHYDNWFWEQQLHDSGAVAEAIDALRLSGNTYEKDGAVWLAASRLGAKTDCALVREDGTPTYLAADIAYHRNKFTRGFDRVIDIWSVEHEAYVARTLAALRALDVPLQRLSILTVQDVCLLEDREPVWLPNDPGEPYELDALLNEMDGGAVRWYCLARPLNATAEIDLDEARCETEDNAFYRVRRAHARMAALANEAASRGIAFAEPEWNLLTAAPEQHFARVVADLSDVLQRTAATLEPQRLVRYAEVLVGAFDAFYNAVPIYDADTPLRTARLALVASARTALARALALMGIDAPEDL